MNRFKQFIVQQYRGTDGESGAAIWSDCNPKHSAFDDAKNHLCLCRDKMKRHRYRMIIRETTVIETEIELCNSGYLMDYQKDVLEKLSANKHWGLYLGGDR